MTQAKSAIDDEIRKFIMDRAKKGKPTKQQVGPMVTCRLTLSEQDEISLVVTGFETPTDPSVAPEVSFQLALDDSDSDNFSLAWSAVTAWAIFDGNLGAVQQEQGLDNDAFSSAMEHLHGDDSNRDYGDWDSDFSPLQLRPVDPRNVAGGAPHVALLVSGNLYMPFIDGGVATGVGTLLRQLCVYANEVDSYYTFLVDTAGLSTDEASEAVQPLLKPAAFSFTQDTITSG
jgi:hypothetical protein